MVAVYWSHWTNFYHHNVPLPELISHATAQLLDCKRGEIWGTHFYWTMWLWRSWSCRRSTGRFFKQLWPLIAKCRSAWTPHSVVINCICPFHKKDWSNFLLSNKTMQRLLFRDRSVLVGATLPEAFFSLVPAWLFLKGSQDVHYFCWLL